MRWALFIDESGDFETDSETWAVGGVLFRNPPPDLRERLRGIIASRLPHVPYPPHSTQLRLPGAYAAYALALETQSSAPHPVKDLHEAANRIRASKLSPWAAGILESVEKGRSLRYNDLQFVMKGCPVYVKRALHVAAQDGTDRVRASLADAAALGAHAVAAVLDPASAVEPADPYLALLEAVIERAVALARPGVRATSFVDVWIASRSTPPRGRVSSRAAVETPGGEVVVGKPIVESLSNPRAHPGLVLADFVTNHLGSVTVASSWKEVEAYASERLRLNVQIASEPLAATLPSMAAWGPARDAIEGASRGERALIHGEGWHADQARTWIEAISAVLGSAR